MDVLDRFDNLPEGVQEIIKEKVWELEAEEDLEIWNTWYKYYHDVVAAELTLIVGARTQDPECNGVWSEEEVAADVLRRAGVVLSPLRLVRFDWGYFHECTEGDFEWVIPELYEALEGRPVDGL
tara:strand:+ start:415 stop:786 length:372 start_codon:yes stop_codon:yes gene_type:complete